MIILAFLSGVSLGCWDNLKFQDTVEYGHLLYNKLQEWYRAGYYQI